MAEPARFPYRYWTRFLYTTARGDCGAVPFSACTIHDGWTEEHVDFAEVGRTTVTMIPIHYLQYQAGYKPSDPSYGLEAGADIPLDWLLKYTLCRSEYAGTYTKMTVQPDIQAETPVNVFDWDLISGRHYDGVNDYTGYPPFSIYGCLCPGTEFDFAGGDFVVRGEEWACCYRSGVGPPVFDGRQEMFTNGLMAWVLNWTGANGAGNQNKVTLAADSLKIEYLNPVVNDLSAYQISPAGGDPLIFTGHEFASTDAEITQWKNTNNAIPGGGFQDHVDYIYFEGLQGQGTFSISRTLGDFTIDSYYQITVPAMPALPEGTYEIRLRKNLVTGFAMVESYAGDWWCEIDGRMHHGTRITLEVSDRTPKIPPGDPIILTRWRWRKGGYLYKTYAEIDVRAPEIFYDGRINRMSNIARAMDDDTGLFSISDMTVEIINTDLEISGLLAGYFIRNQPVEIFQGWDTEPESWKRPLCHMMVDDAEMKGPIIVFKLKNIFQKDFTKRLPTQVCTIDEYPNIHPDEVGKPMPEILGLAQHTTGETPGAVKAIYIDTTTFTYLAARGSLHAIPQVYGDGQIIAPADYAIFYADGGRTYIRFSGDQGSKKITFNAEGYMFADWDSANGYVQNPAYLLAFYIGFLVEVYEDLVNLPSFDDLAGIYETMGAGEAGYLIIQDDQDAWTLLGELLWTFGAKCYPAADGRLTVGRKDISNYASNVYIWAQVDSLDFPSRPLNLKTAINYAKIRWAFYPTANLYGGAKEASRQSSIEDFEARLEPSGPWEFRWTASETLVDIRASEELLKRGYGDKRISFDLALEHFDRLDLFTSFRLQDPFGLSTTGTGEVGRYYYIESLDYDPDRYAIGVTGVDLQYLLRQYFVLGDRLTLPANWAGAGDNDRMWGYLCDRLTGRFPDDEPGKMLADRAQLEGE